MHDVFYRSEAEKQMLIQQVESSALRTAVIQYFAGERLEMLTAISAFMAVAAQYQARLLYGNKLIEADRVTMRNDIKNPVPALRNRSLQNAVIAARLRYADSEWTDGVIYDAASGSSYHCKASMKEGKLQLRGYMGIPALGQTQEFHRIAR